MKKIIRKGELLFDVNDIHKINGYYEEKTNFVFKPAVPWRQKYILKFLDKIYPFRAIKWGIVPGLPDRWEYLNSINGDFEDDRFIRNANGLYRVDEETKTVFKKPKLIIEYKNGKVISIYCDDNNELRDIISRIRNATKNPIVWVELT